jgi:hypothetical protein
MRRFILIPAVLVALAVMPAVASAQGGHGAPDFQDRFTEEFVDDDFCGTGAGVEIVESTVANGWGLEGEEFFKLAFRTRLSFTYGDTTIYAQRAGQDFQVTEGDPEGAHTELITATGLRAFLLVPGEGAVTLDHGFIQFLATFDENGEFVGLEC